MEYYRENIEAQRQDGNAVVEYMKRATLQLIEVTPEERQALEDNFWPTHVALMEKYEQIQLGITAQVFDLFEQMGEEDRAQKAAQHEQRMRQLKRRPFLQGVLGISLDKDFPL